MRDGNSPSGSSRDRRSPDGVVRDGTAERTCDRCEEPVDGHVWHPVAFDDVDGAIRKFCSTDCKRDFFSER